MMATDLIDPDALLERIARTEALLQWINSDLGISLALVGLVVGYQVVMLWWESGP